MGNSTIIELNHDLASEIEDNPELFLEQIRNTLHYGYPNYEYPEDKDILGGKVICFSHRDDKPYRLFLDFKQKLDEWREIWKKKR